MTQIAEEITQEVFLKLHQHLESDGAPPDDMAGWLYRITKNEAVDVQKRRSAAKRDGDRKVSSLSELDVHSGGLNPVAGAAPDFEKTLEAIVASFDLSEGIRRRLHERFESALRALPERERLVYLLHTAQRLPYKTVVEHAEENGFPISSDLARQIVKRTRADLAKALEELDYFDDPARLVRGYCEPLLRGEIQP